MCEFEPRSWRGVLDTTLWDKFCQRLSTGRWVSPGTSVCSNNITDRHDITEILLKVAVNTIKLNLSHFNSMSEYVVGGREKSNFSDPTLYILFSIFLVVIYFS